MQSPKSQSLEKTLFEAADKLRKNIDAAEYKHIVLGLVFLRYISQSFSEACEVIAKEGGDIDDRDEFVARYIFYLPQKSRFDSIRASAKLPTIGKIIDDAMMEIERENISLKGVLPKVYNKENLDSIALGGLIDLIANIDFSKGHSSDILGHIFEYFLGEFALNEGKKGGQFYTPKSVVELLVAMLKPYSGRVFDPCCGSGGMFVQSEEFVRSHQGNIDDISIYGQESNQTTWRLAKMNLAIRKIDSSQIAWNSEGSFLNDAHKDLRVDFIIANPPFNDSDWSGESLAKDARWAYGVPPKNNANYAWIQHFVYHLAPRGVAGFVLAKGSLTSNTAGEGEIRRALIEANLIECIVNLPAKLFLNTQIPACLWFVRRGRPSDSPILFIDARNLGELINRKTKILRQSDIAKIAQTYHAWREFARLDKSHFDSNPNKSRESSLDSEQNSAKYEDIKGFCKSANLEEVANLGYTLTPGRFVGLQDDDEEIDFEAEFTRLKDELSKSLAQESILNKQILENLAKIKI